MSEFSLPPNTTNNNNNKSKKTNFFSLLLSDCFFLFCSFIISHPLYFSYLIFFSPYIIRILSFLSPLFITTSLLLLSLFTTFLCSNNADDANYGQQPLIFEDLEAYYKIVFDTSSSFENIREDEVSEEEEEEEEEERGLIATSEEAPVDKHTCHESNQLIVEGDKEVKPLKVDELKKVEEASNKAMEKVRVDSQSLGAVSGDDDDEHLWSDESDVGLCKTQSFGSSLGSFGSMRKEKEWRRTLACKLFEERHNNNVEGSDEGMDMLWETYESESNKKQQQKQQKQQQQLAKSKSKKGKKWSKYKHDDDDEEEEEEEEEIDDDDAGQLCCLQALKFSAGKMNLGMGRPNLVKISKAFKGIGWLHSMTKHGKKIYH